MISAFCECSCKYWNNRIHMYILLVHKAFNVTMTCMHILTCTWNMFLCAEKRRLSSKAIIAIHIIVPLVIVVVLLSSLCYPYRSWKAKKKHNARKKEIGWKQRKKILFYHLIIQLPFIIIHPKNKIKINQFLLVWNFFFESNIYMYLFPLWSNTWALPRSESPIFITMNIFNSFRLNLSL
jgi:hypothetical protein